MKIRNFILLILCLFLSNGNFAQSDTACVKTRWIAVKNSPQNAILFDTTTNILRTIREYVQSNKIGLYHESNTSFTRGQWYPIPLIQYDSSHYANYVDYERSNDINLFTITIQSDLPLVDEFGENIIHTSVDGLQSFVYEAPEVHLINLYDIVEFRIREERIYNESTHQFEGDFHPTGISFYLQDQQYRREIFWISLDELKNKLSDAATYPWYSFLQNRAYTGFQYMQVSCYDDLIRY
jgi:hypothetical protein